MKTPLLYPSSPFSFLCRLFLKVPLFFSFSVLGSGVCGYERQTHPTDMKVRKVGNFTCSDPAGKTSQTSGMSYLDSFTTLEKIF